jgi:hypothetical protein
MNEHEVVNATGLTKLEMIPIKPAVFYP